MVDFIKIPKDFKSIHELKELVSNYGLVRRLIAALDDYQCMYVNSFLMNLDEVLTYIPEVQHEEYKVKLRNDVLTKFDSKSFEKLSFQKALLSVDVDKTKKIFLVNTVDKIVDTCFWAEFGLPIIDKDKFRPDVKYTGFLTYKVCENSEKMYAFAEFSFTNHRTVGGVTINAGTPYSYLSGGKTERFLDFDTDTYTFCTKTNKYLGFEKGGKSGRLY